MGTHTRIEVIGLIVALGVGLTAATADAQRARSRDDEGVTGFFFAGAGELTGVVADPGGAPRAHVVVHIVGPTGAEQLVTTDAAGHYHGVLRGGGTTSVFVHGSARITGQLSPDTPEAVVEIHEVVPPAVAPKPRGALDRVLDYTDAAVDKNQWTRAWLMLDVDERGTVTRLAVVGAPGMGLEPIAIRAAFDLQFEPARDRSNRPTRALVLWSYEWPSYWWMVAQHQGMRRLPPQVLGETCRDPARPRPEDRDCSRPDVTRAAALPWRERPAR